MGAIFSCFTFYIPPILLNIALEGWQLEFTNSIFYNYIMLLSNQLRGDIDYSGFRTMESPDENKISTEINPP